jgi:hypothetical protein
MSKTHTRKRGPKHEPKPSSSSIAKKKAAAKHAPPGGALIGRRVGRSSKDLGDVMAAVSGEERRAGMPSTARRNATKPSSKASYDLEDSVGTPTRKSTRRAGATHVKSDANLKLRQTRAVTSPKARATAAASDRTRSAKARAGAHS